MSLFLDWFVYQSSTDNCTLSCFWFWFCRTCCSRRAQPPRGDDPSLVQGLPCYLHNFPWVLNKDLVMDSVSVDSRPYQWRSTLYSLSIPCFCLSLFLRHLLRRTCLWNVWAMLGVGSQCCCFHSYLTFWSPTTVRARGGKSRGTDTEGNKAFNRDLTVETSNQKRSQGASSRRQGLLGTL